MVLPVLGAIIGLIVSRTLRPLKQLKQQLSVREVGHLQPLSLDKLPEEVVPMVEQINALFVLLEQAFANERNFTSDASHELRTPLAGMMTQLQVAQKTTDETMRVQALQKCQMAVVRMTHMVQQLLTLSRVQHQNAQVNKQILDVNQALVSVMADIEPAAREKHIEIELKGQDGFGIVANPQLLDILFRNLLDNAIKYTPEGGKVLVKLMHIDSQIGVSVEDSGPGVADADYSRISQRFYRCVETAQTAEGSGLGLSIVQRIIRLHDADIEFAKSALNGLKVSLRFDLATSTG
jgi:two-component system sensor histidine kinase QseC